MWGISNRRASTVPTATASLSPECAAPGEAVTRDRRGDAAWSVVAVAYRGATLRKWWRRDQERLIEELPHAIRRIRRQDIDRPDLRSADDNAVPRCCRSRLRPRQGIHPARRLHRRLTPRTGDMICSPYTFHRFRRQRPCRALLHPIALARRWFHLRTRCCSVRN